MTRKKAIPQRLEQAPLPYGSPNELLDVMSFDQLLAHYEGNHAQYVRRGNELLKKKAKRRLGNYDNARLTFEINGAQLHNLWWENLRSPYEQSAPPRAVTDLFGGSAAALEKEIFSEGKKLMGNGWVALSQLKRNSKRADVHVVTNHDYNWSLYRPLLLIDLWEHAFYLDYEYERDEYARRIYECVNWDVVAGRIQ